MINAKSTGIVRGIDILGRISIPRELSKSLGYADDQLINIWVDGDFFILQKNDEGVPGVTRKLDALGRVVIPSEIRKHYHIQEDTPFEYYLREDYEHEQILLKFYEKTCSCCNQTAQPNVFHLRNGREICEDCVEWLREVLAKQEEM